MIVHSTFQSGYKQLAVQYSNYVMQWCGGASQYKLLDSTNLSCASGTVSYDRSFKFETCQVYHRVSPVLSSIFAESGAADGVTIGLVAVCCRAGALPDPSAFLIVSYRVTKKLAHLTTTAIQLDEQILSKGIPFFTLVNFFIHRHQRLCVS
ncbi:hypothetical protein M405DRAFT_808568, partial [Rhizopogon salebrosus TDB-379]